MKRERWIAGLTGAALAFILSLGAVGCMITGFGLPIQNMALVVLTCGFFSVFCAGCFCLRRGGTVVLCLLALLSGFLWRRGEAAKQVLLLIYRISYVYNSAYNCGVVRLTEGKWDSGIADYPMAILGCIIAIAVSRTVCRRKNAWPAVVLSVLPLALCLVVTDTVPGAGYLLALMVGLGILILTNGTRRESPTQGNRLTAMVTLPVIVCMALLFLAVPQEGYVNRSREVQDKLLTYVQQIPQLVGSAVEDLTLDAQGREPQSINLGSLGARMNYTYPVMEVTADTGGTLYLRGQDYDAYDGTGWTASERRAESFGYAGEAAGDVTIRTRGRKDVVYLPYYPGPDTTLTGGRLDNGGNEREYTMTRYTLPRTWRETGAPEADDGVYLTTAGGSVMDASSRYLTLPSETGTRAKALLDSILTDRSAYPAMADAIGAYVRNSADYDLKTGRMPAGQTDFALWFLEESETGYCVHFATAAVVLLRAAGIPARYVTGYMVEAKAGETVTVTAGNTHAWAEYFVPNLGTWVILEATPAIDSGAQTEPAPTVRETEAVMTTEPVTHPTQPEATQAPETQPSVEGGEAAPKPAPDLSWLKGLARGLILLAGAAALAVIQRLLRVELRRRKQYTGEANAQALARWKEAGQLGWLLKEPPPEELERLAQKAMFSQHTLSAEELGRFERYLRACRRRLRGKPWYLRLIYQYLFAAY